jgi:Fur family peroxide stress response transcriptional regulator
MSNIQTLTHALQEAGMRLTPQRQAICKLLTETGEHPTATMIYESLKPHYESLSLATVYNTLETLVDLGVVNTLGHVGDKNCIHYDAETEPHVNLACIACHKIIDLPSAHVTHLAGEITDTSGYKLLGARVVYYGICPACQKKSNKSNRSN